MAVHLILDVARELLDVASAHDEGRVCPAIRGEAEGLGVVLRKVERVGDEYLVGGSGGTSLVLEGNGVGHIVNRLDVVALVVVAPRSYHLVGIV